MKKLPQHAGVAFIFVFTVREAPPVFYIGEGTLCVFTTKAAQRSTHGYYTHLIAGSPPAPACSSPSQPQIVKPLWEPFVALFPELDPLLDNLNNNCDSYLQERLRLEQRRLSAAAASDTSNSYPPQREGTQADIDDNNSSGGGDGGGRGRGRRSGHSSRATPSEGGLTDAEEELVRMGGGGREKTPLSRSSSCSPSPAPRIRRTLQEEASARNFRGAWGGR